MAHSRGQGVSLREAEANPILMAVGLQEDVQPDPYQGGVHSHGARF